MLIPILFLTLLVVSCGYASWKGGRSERAGAAILFAGAVLTPLVETSRAGRWHHAEFGVLAVDLAMLTALIVLLLRSKRFWPIWMASFQLATVLAHLGPIARTGQIAFPFAVAEQSYSWIMLLLLAWVTWLTNRRERANAALS